MSGVFCNQSNVNAPSSSSSKRCPERRSCADSQCFTKKTGRIFSVQQKDCCCSQVSCEVFDLGDLNTRVLDSSPSGSTVTFLGGVMTKVCNIVHFTGQLQIESPTGTIGRILANLELPFAQKGGEPTITGSLVDCQSGVVGCINKADNNKDALVSFLPPALSAPDFQTRATVNFTANYQATA